MKRARSIAGILTATLLALAVVVGVACAPDPAARASGAGSETAAKGNLAAPDAPPASADVTAREQCSEPFATKAELQALQVRLYEFPVPLASQPFQVSPNLMEGSVSSLESRIGENGGFCQLTKQVKRLKARLWGTTVLLLLLLLAALTVVGTIWYEHRRRQRQDAPSSGPEAEGQGGEAKEAEEPPSTQTARAAAARSSSFLESLFATWFGPRQEKRPPNVVIPLPVSQDQLAELRKKLEGQLKTLGEQREADVVKVRERLEQHLEKGFAETLEKFRAELRAESVRLGKQLETLATTQKTLESLQVQLEERIQKQKDELARRANVLEDKQRKLEEEDRQLSKKIDETPARQTEASATLERQLLGSSWRFFQERNPVLVARLQHLTGGAGLRDLSDLLEKLRDSLGSNAELASTCDELHYPVRQLVGLTNRLASIPRLVQGPEPTSSPADPVAELKRARELAPALAVVQFAPGAAERLQFEPRQWVRERFLSFADLVLRAALGAPAVTALSAAAEVVKKILALGEIELIEVKPGDEFDSKVHIGMGSSFERNSRDGAILEVVRNGFRERGGRVVQAPEVIVNRR